MNASPLDRPAPTRPKGFWKDRWVPTLVYGVLRALCATLRFEVEDRCGFTDGSLRGPAVCVMWHNRILVIPYAYRRFCRGRRGAVLTSASKDGSILAGVVAHFQMRAVRGSSSRRGGVAMRELVSLIEGGSDVGITPDGPRGPVYSLSPGAVKLAELTGAPMLPVEVHYDRFWTLKSWDGFRIPKPFSRVRVAFGPLHTLEPVPTLAHGGDGVPPSEESLFQKEMARLEAVMARGIHP
jgi:hypothetical protein